MRAFLVTSRSQGSVEEVVAPEPASGEVVIDVARVGICGTDVSLFFGDEARLAHARVRHPLRLGHEWSGTVRRLGADVAPEWLGARVTGDTMLGCGHCHRCLRGDHHVCADRYEVGVRGGWAGALAEQLVMPAHALHRLPDSVSDAAGAMVEPGGNAWRAVDAAALQAGERLLVLGPGTIGLLSALFGVAAGAEVHVLGRSPAALSLARDLGVAGAWTRDALPELPWRAVIDATDAAAMPALAADVVEPAGRVVYIGISGTPSEIDTRTLVRKDVTAIGILGGSAGLAQTIAAYESGAVDPLPLLDRTVGLADVADEFTAPAPSALGAPKVHVDPTR